MSTIDQFYAAYDTKLRALINKVKQDQLLVMAELTPEEKEIAMIMTKAGVLEDIANRVLITKNAPLNDFLIRQLVLGQGIYTGNTALYLWQLSDTFPYTIQLAVRLGYQKPGHRYAEWTQNVQFKQVRKPRLTEDVEKISITGTTRKIRVYSRERVLTELVKPANRDPELLKESFQRYLRSPQRNLNKLMATAQRLRRANQVQELVGIML